MIEITSLILLLRPDFSVRFGFGLSDSVAAYTFWLVTDGALEYVLLTEDDVFRQSLELTSADDGLTGLQRSVLWGRPDVKAAFDLPAKLPEFFRWFYTHGVTEHALWQWLTPAERVRALGQPKPWAEQMAARAAAYAETLRTTPPVQQCPWGVNLVGYAFGQLGIGEDVRMAARALLSAGVPITILNFPPGAGIGQNDTSMADHVTRDGPFAFNLFCLTALENGRFYAERGRKQFAARYNIGYWPWELSQWPAQWEELVNLVDEVWVSTQHTLDALAPVIEAMAHPVPVRLNTCC